MPKYEYKTSYTSKIKKPKRLRRVIFLVLIILVGLLAWALVDWLLQRDESQQSQQTTLAYQAEATNHFNTEYFEFSTNSNWREMTEENRLNRYVYRSFNSNLVEDELVIEVNEPAQKSLAEQTSDRVLAVTITAEGKLTVAGDVSAHCKEVYPESSFALPKIVQMNNTSFLCNPNSTQYDVVLAELGGGPRLSITRPNMIKTDYYIDYKSYMTEPNTDSLFQILKSFKVR